MISIILNDNDSKKSFHFNIVNDMKDKNRQTVLVIHFAREK